LTPTIGKPDADGKEAHAEGRKPNADGMTLTKAKPKPTERKSGAGARKA
jgi:hypothetical protein